MTRSAPLDHYAVMGNPIGHSRSPMIHRLFAEQTGEALDYRAILVEPHDFAAAVARFRADGGKGLNVTVPFKEEAFELADRHSDRALRARAVNTLLLHADGTIEGDNTDGIGLLRDLVDNLGLSLAGRRIALLGAGGAARGILAPLLAAQPATLFIANRTAAKAAQLADDFTDLGPVHGGGFDALAGMPFDLVLNATAASLSGDLPPLPDNLLAPGACTYDLMYGREPTPFLRWAETHGATRRADGLGMLVEQAAESFQRWRGVMPATAPVIASVRAAL